MSDTREDAQWRELGIEPPGLAAVAAPDPETVAAVAALVARIDKLRRAGDTARALRLVDEALDGPALSGAAQRDWLEERLFRDLGCDEAASPALVRHLARRFDWRSTTARIAGRHPEAYSTVLRRLKAEDWLDELDRDSSTPAAQRPDTLEGIARLALTRFEALPPNVAIPVDLAPVVARILQRVWQFDVFVAYRFDARTLGWLRRAIEPRPAAPAPATLPRNSPPRTLLQRFARRLVHGMDAIEGRTNQVDRRTALWVSRVSILVVVDLLVGLLRDRLFPLAAPRPAPSEAQQDLRAADRIWIEAVDGQLHLSFDRLLALDPDVVAVDYGVNQTEPDQRRSLIGQSSTFVELPSSTSYVSVQVVFKDGSQSSVNMLSHSPTYFTPGVAR